MFSIIFGMKENGRFGEVEEKLPTIISYKIVSSYLSLSPRNIFEKSKLLKIILSTLEMIK